MTGPVGPLLLMLAVLLGAAPAAAWSGAAAPRPQATDTPRVVVVGVAGLRWGDVGPQTPTIARLSRHGAVGALSVKALQEISCPADGWFTLGAGARAQAYDTACGDYPGADASEDRSQRERNEASRDGARLGALAEALDGRVQAAGAGAAAAVAGTPAARPGDLLLVDAGVVRDGGGADDRGGPPRADRGEDLRAADDRVAAAVGELPAGADLLVVGVSGAPDDVAAHLHVALATGPSFSPGALSSASTRRAPYVQLIDVAPTVLDLLGEPEPEQMDGEPWQVAGPAPTLTSLADLDTKAVAHKQATVPFFVVLVAGQLVLFTALRGRPPLLRLAALAGTAAIGSSYVANLVPWWRAGQPLAALLAVVAVLSVAAGLAVRGRRHPVGLLAGGTALVLAVDLVTGAHLQMASVAGYSPLVAGRFAGLGNTAFGAYAATGLLATASLVSGRRRPGLLVATVGVAAVLVIGAPPWGSDVGGVLALLPAFALLGLLLTGTRVSVLRLGLAALIGVAVVTAFALADHARPPQDRTHLGRFVADVAEGTAGDVLSRKADAVFGLLFHSPVTAALPLVVGVAGYLAVRPPAALHRAFLATPALRPGLAAVAAASALGFALNDSGAAVPALALLVVVPATVSVVAATAGRSGAPQPDRPGTYTALPCGGSFEPAGDHGSP